MFDLAVFGSLFLTLFVIMDPPGITPIFLALTAGRPGKVQKRMAFQAVCVAGGVITVFGLLGHQILNYLHVSVPALMIAGGLLLLLIALDLLTGKTDEPKQTKDVNVALVPLGMPLLAGPGRSCRSSSPCRRPTRSPRRCPCGRRSSPSTSCCGW
ncbi:putative UPF0056 membrane protein [Streptomyces afghaniensis 772]|uniref:UPF0056 membrane protein n=1 Tax=Streptomyces afghaniensis 772 TaxID=1283301 RepID=S4NRH2_9ACTN|nr:putative UPF0056 membrane protein [Streptomyces afghaniensis 772]